MQVTIREALEQVNGVAAIEHLQTKRLAPTTTQQGQAPKFMGGDAQAMLEHEGDILPVQSTIRRDDEAKAHADSPQLTGDPEWDALELAETDPTKPPLEIRW